MPMNITANGTTALTPERGSEGGIYSFKVQGTFGGATVTLGYSLNSGVTVTPYGPDSVLTANGGCAVEVAATDRPYVVVSGGTNPNLNMDFLKIPQL